MDSTTWLDTARPLGHRAGLPSLDRQFLTAKQNAIQSGPRFPLDTRPEGSSMMGVMNHKSSPNPKAILSVESSVAVTPEALLVGA